MRTGVRPLAPPTRAIAPLAIGSIAIAIALLACTGGTDVSAQSSSRCAHCGMRVDPASSWRAGLTAADGTELAFDAPKCMLRVLRSGTGRGAGARDPWVIEYYSAQRRRADDLFFVLGSDVRGPMGRDLVPIDGRERADRFARDHHAERVLALAEITTDVIDALFRP
jgi:copper chaperone NosL